MKNILTNSLLKQWSKPWLITGKGPTFKRYTTIDILKFNVFTLNHTCRFVKPSIAHFIDFEAYLDCHKFVLDPDITLLMPEYPHFGEKPIEDKPLVDLVPHRPGLGLKNSQDQLYWYPLSTHESESSIKVHHFSAEAAFEILGRLNIKEIYTIGVDGGVMEALEFSRENRTRPLTYEPQMEHLDAIVDHYKMKWVRL